MFDIKAKIRFKNGQVATVYITKFKAENKHEAEALYVSQMKAKGNTVLMISVTEK